MNAELYRELGALPSGVRQTLKGWCFERIETLRDELEAASESNFCLIQGGISELRTLLRAMERQDESRG